MDLSPYIESVRHGVTNAAALADESTQQVAHRLGAAIESSTRLAIIEALSDAAGTISAELAPASVELRMSGQNPEFVVSVPAPDPEPTLLRPPEDAAAEEPEYEDEPVARVSLRLPNSVKTKVDELADADGISTNAWLIRAVMDALAGRRRGDNVPPVAPVPPVPLVFGAGGPFGPNGVFGPGGVFGPNGPFGGSREDRRAGRDREHGHTGNVQGWVR
ncbi:MAG: hypothetical protein QOF52_3242 [Propionibacteriaceae bacterium]|jgi:hypothetical protein|nr:hypothetical protein [Propionibacteriaceae bacterium]